ncbi:tetratricopeptide repeat protein [Nonomuraea sp. B10E15]|uniref:tetratricopeptide repeat protein n=1 Tax=Nonomuraea sp. B10E15 TaxID=3153560 RepID=UPI00325D2C76
MTTNAAGQAGKMDMNGNDLLARAEQLAEAEDYQGAAAVYAEAARQGVPGAAIAYSEILIHLEDYATAEPVLREALAAGEAEARDWLADLLVQTGRAVEAAQLMEQAVGHEVAALRAATIWADAVGDRERAEEWYRKAVERGEPGALNDFGTFLSEDDSRQDEAEHLFRQAAEQGDALAFGNLGSLELDRGAPEAAVAWLRRSLEAEDQTGSTALLKLATAEAQLGNDDAARELYDRAVTERLAGAHVERATFLVERGEDEAAEADFRAAVENDDEGARYYYGEFLVNNDRVGEAVDHLDRAVADGSDAAHETLAKIYLERGAIKAAEDHFKKSIAAGWLSAVFAYAGMLRSEGRGDEVAALASEAERLGATPDQIAELTG